MSICLSGILASLVICCSNKEQKIIGADTSNTYHYTLVKDWPKLQEKYVFGNPTGIGIDSSQNVFVFHRAGREWPLVGAMPPSLISKKTIYKLDRSTGEVMSAWGENLFIMPHGLTVDKQNNVWVTDVALHLVFKFSADGKLLMKLGEERVAGDDSSHFDMPTDVAVAPDGSFYVSDGYGNSRVVKFSSTGKYLFEWGKKGNGSGEFDIPHGIDLDKKGNVHVADRENNRIQVFDSTGKFLREAAGEYEKMYSVCINKLSHHIIGVDYKTSFLIPDGSDIILFDSAANKIIKFGRSGSYDGPVCRYHDVAVDNEGSIYVGDIAGNNVQKFRRVRH